MSKTVCVRTFGRQIKECNTDKMVDVIAESGGYERTDPPREADLIVFNTCPVRGHGLCCRGGKVYRDSPSGKRTRTGNVRHAAVLRR